MRSQTNKGHKQEKMDHKSKSSKKEIPGKIQKEQKKRVDSDSRQVIPTSKRSKNVGS